MHSVQSPKELVQGLEDLEIKGRVETELQYYCDQLEFKKEFWRIDEPCCHSDSSGKPSAHTGVKNSQMSKIMIMMIIILKITMEHEDDGNTNCNWCTWNDAQKLSKKTRRVGNHNTSGDYSIVEVGQNTEKSPGDLRRLAVIQTPVKDHQLTFVWKTRKEQYNNNNNNYEKKVCLFFFLVKDVNRQCSVIIGHINIRARTRRLKKWPTPYEKMRV